MMQHTIAQMHMLSGFRARPQTAIAAAAMLLVFVAIFALGTGAVWIKPAVVIDTVIRQIGVHGWEIASSVEQSIILNVRLPRVLLGLSGGALLAITGVLMQAFFRNPLADPALIGVATGGALGAVAMIVVGSTLFSGLTQFASMLVLPSSAFVGSLVASSIVFVLARHDGTINVTTMLLCGIAVNAMAGAGIGLLSFMADDAQLRDLTFWSLGSLGAAGWWQVQVVMTALLITALVCPLLLMALNALLLGDSEALHLGYPVEKLKITILLLTCLGAGAVVAVCGVIGFVGLIAPHLSRLIVGPDHRYALPLAGLLGGALLTGADIVARTIVVPAELPIGVLTALTGGPVFLWLLRRRRRGAFHVGN